MLHVKSTAIAAGTVLFILACNHRNIVDKKSEDVQQYAMDIPTQITPATDTGIHYEQEEIQYQAPGSPIKYQQGISPAATDWDSKIIRTASIQVETTDLNRYGNLLKQKIKQLGGYLAQEQLSQSDYKMETTVLLRVPVDQFDNAIGMLTDQADKILAKEITANDVTGEMVDTRSRMETKKQVRLRYLYLLQQAKKMDDILQVQQEINTIQEEIESGAARVAWLSHAAAYSSIQLTYIQVLNPAAGGDAAFHTKVWQSFTKGWHWIGNFILELVGIWPLLLFLSVIWIALKKAKHYTLKRV